MQVKREQLDSWNGGSQDDREMTCLQGVDQMYDDQPMSILINMYICVYIYIYADVCVYRYRQRYQVQLTPTGKSTQRYTVSIEKPKMIIL